MSWSSLTIQSISSHCFCFFEITFYSYHFFNPSSACEYSAYSVNKDNKSLNSFSFYSRASLFHFSFSYNFYWVLKFLSAQSYYYYLSSFSSKLNTDLKVLYSLSASVIVDFEINSSTFLFSSSIYLIWSSETIM